MSPHQIDAWTATLTRRLDAIQAAILDLIDTGTEAHPPSGHVFTPTRKGTCRICDENMHSHERRPATHKEKTSQDRRDGHFYPTPPGNTRQPIHRSNPVLGAVTRWESQVEAAVTELVGTVGEVSSVLVALGIEPYDEDGRPAKLPKEPPVRTTQSGRVVAECSPARSRWIVLDSIVWLTAACGALADRMRVSDDVSDRGHYVERLTFALARQVGVLEPRRCVREGCTRLAPVGSGTVCDACRKAEYREAKSA